jgi:transposase-like protein
MKRRRYSNEFKEEMVRLVLDSIPEKSMYQVSKEVGVSYTTVCKWVHAYQSKTDPSKMERTPSMQEEIRNPSYHFTDATCYFRMQLYESIRMKYDYVQNWKPTFRRYRGPR